MFDWKLNIKIRQGFVCLVCGKTFKERDLTIHHKKAKGNGGSNNPNNCVAWCKACHRQYHAKYGNRESNDFGKPIRK